VAGSISLDVVQVSATTVAAQQTISAKKAKNKLVRRIMEDIVPGKQRLLNRRPLNTIVLHRENLYAVRGLVKRKKLHTPNATRINVPAARL
jgi:hypothetical protein